MQFAAAVLDPVSFEAHRKRRARDAVTQFIVHTQVDAPGPHGSIRGWWEAKRFATTLSLTREGVLYQYFRDAHRKPGGTQTADVRAITIETEDDGDPELHPWTNRQLVALIDTIDEACRYFPIGRCAITEDDRFHRSDPRRWDAPGIGDHTLPHWRDNLAKSGWIELPKSSRWTSARGKICVGSTRARQLYGEVIPEVALRAGNTQKPYPAAGTSTVLGFGDRGPGVETLQQILVGSYGHPIAVDGIFGSSTLTAVRITQGFLGVRVDGLWGAESASASWVERQQRRPNLYPRLYGEWMVGPDVDEVRARFGFDPGPYSTWFVSAVVQPWQRDRGLPDDGVIDRDDWAVLGNGS